MIRSLFCLIIGGGLLLFISVTEIEMPTALRIAVWLFGLLFCFAAWSSARHHTRLLQARKSAPVDATILVRATPRSKGPDNLVAEITVGQDVWRGTLTGWSRERVFSNQTHEGKAWIYAPTGAPLEVEIQGQVLTPIPVVIKVNPDGILEQIVRKVHSLDEFDKKHQIQ